MHWHSCVSTIATFLDSSIILPLAGQVRQKRSSGNAHQFNVYFKSPIVLSSSKLSYLEHLDKNSQPTHDFPCPSNSYPFKSGMNQLSYINGASRLSVVALDKKIQNSSQVTLEGAYKWFLWPPIIYNIMKFGSVSTNVLNFSPSCDENTIYLLPYRKICIQWCLSNSKFPNYISTYRFLFWCQKKLKMLLCVFVDYCSETYCSA